LILINKFIMNKVIKNIVLALIFVLPVFILPNTFYPMAFSKSILIEGTTLFLATLWIIGKLFKKDATEIQKNIVYPIFGLYIFFILISSINGIFPPVSFWSTFDKGTGLIFMVCLFVLSIIISSVFKKIEDWYKVFAVFVTSGIFFSLGSFLTVLGVKFSDVLIIDAPSGFLIGNSSWAGLYLTFVFFISLGLVFSSKIKSQKVIGILGAITAFFNPVLTGFVMQVADVKFGFIGFAQTASYSMFFGIGLLVLYLIFRKIESYKIRKIFISSVLGICIVSMISLAFIGLGPIRNFITEKAGPNRLVFWDIAIQGFKERPILGSGNGSYPYLYGKYFNPIILDPSYSPEFWVDRAHNIYFDELVSSGIIGFILLIFLYGIILWGLLKAAIKQEEKEGILFMTLFIGVMSFLIQGLMIFQISMGWFIIALLLAFVANFCFKDWLIFSHKDNHRKNSNGNNLNWALSVVVIIIFVTTFKYVIIQPYKISRGLGVFSTMHYNQRLEFYKELDNSYIGNTLDLGNAFNPHYVKFRKMIKSGLTEEEKILIFNEIKQMSKVADHGLKKQNYMDMKLLISSSGMYSILTGLASKEERQVYYDKGMFYVNKMNEISEKNPLVKLSKVLLDLSLEYGEEGINAFDTEIKN